MQVQSDYNFVRGGDIDELRIYDRMLSDENVASLARGDAAGAIPPLRRTLDAPAWRDEWWLPLRLESPGRCPGAARCAGAVAIRKVEIHDVYDLKRWWWKATDGIRETTWPGVYNRSRLAGRNDYFQLPDWDSYSLSGKAVTFSMPDEPWNQLEISGAAWGSMTLEGAATPLFAAAEGAGAHIPSTCRAPMRGKRIRFTNVEQETPIGELSAYNVTPGREPAGQRPGCATASPPPPNRRTRASSRSSISSPAGTSRDERDDDGGAAGRCAAVASARRPPAGCRSCTS